MTVASSHVSTQSPGKSSALMVLRIRATELRKSGELVWASDVVPHEPAPDVMGVGVIHMMYRPAMLLFGLAAEAYVKALLIHNAPGEDLSVAMSAMSRQEGGHDLLDLCRQASISITSQEKATLVRLTKSVVWMSKYFAPKAIAARNTNDLLRYDGDYYAFRSVYEKIRQALPVPLNAGSD